MLEQTWPSRMSMNAWLFIGLPGIYCVLCFCRLVYYMSWHHNPWSLTAEFWCPCCSVWLLLVLFAFCLQEIVMYRVESSLADVQYKPGLRAKVERSWAAFFFKQPDSVWPMCLFALLNQKRQAWRVLIPCGASSNVCQCSWWPESNTAASGCHSWPSSSNYSLAQGWCWCYCKVRTRMWCNGLALNHKPLHACRMCGHCKNIHYCVALVWSLSSRLVWCENRLFQSQYWICGHVLQCILVIIAVPCGNANLSLISNKMSFIHSVYRDCGRWTALCHASRQGYVSCMQTLLECGTPVDMLDNNTVRKLWSGCAYCGCSEFQELLGKVLWSIFDVGISNSLPASISNIWNFMPLVCSAWIGRPSF